MAEAILIPKGIQYCLPVAVCIYCCGQVINPLFRLNNLASTGYVEQLFAISYFRMSHNNQKGKYP